MKKVLYMTNLPVPYRVSFFEQLGKKVDLTVTFERTSADGRDQKWLSSKMKHFKPVFMHGINIGAENSFCPEICKIIRDGKFDEIIVGGYHTPTSMAAIQYMRIKKIPYYINTDGGFCKADSFIKKKIKTYFISGAKGYFSPGQKPDDYLVFYGAKREKIHRYMFTSLKSEDVLCAPVADSEKTTLRTALGMKEKKIVVGVGQFIHRKGWDVLLEATSSLSSDVGVYIIGGKATDEYILQKKKLGLQNVHFLNFMNKSELARYYRAADFFVLPTREDIWGLVINEAMSYGLPVITTDNCMAGLEMVEDGKNGFIVKTDDVNALSEKMSELIEDPVRCKEMGENSLKTIKKYSIEYMTQNHYEVLR